MLALSYERRKNLCENLLSESGGRKTGREKSVGMGELENWRIMREKRGRQEKEQREGTREEERRKYMDKKGTKRDFLWESPKSNIMGCGY
jgi:hypothetical protein